MLVDFFFTFFFVIYLISIEYVPPAMMEIDGCVNFGWI